MDGVSKVCNAALLCNSDDTAVSPATSVMAAIYVHGRVVQKELMRNVAMLASISVNSGVRAMCTAYIAVRVHVQFLPPHLPATSLAGELMLHCNVWLC